MEAAKEVNANGMGIRGNGMMNHISQMMVQRLNKQRFAGEDKIYTLDEYIKGLDKRSKNNV